jgi:threonine aldolase
MFGGSLRQAWPCAAVALHYLDGFSERFGRAVEAAEKLFRAIAEHEHCQLLRSSASTNVTHLRVRGGDAAGPPERLLASGIAIRPALDSAADGALFELITNETILRRPVAETIEIFLEALART